MEAGPTDGAAQVTWCRACGATSNGQGTCAICATDLVAPDPGPPVVGKVVKLPSKLTTKLAIVIASDAESVSLLGKGEAIQTATFVDYESLEAIQVPGPAVISAPGRLMAARLAAGVGAIKGKWSDTKVAAVAVAFADRDVATRRAAAYDWMALGLYDYVDSLGLSPTEMVWAKALFAARSGDVASALHGLGYLPGGLYPGKIDILVKLIDPILADPELTNAAAVIAEPYSEQGAVARAIVSVLKQSTHGVRLQSLSDVLESSLVDPGLRGELARLAKGIKEGGAEHPQAPGVLPATKALAVYRQGLAGAIVDRDSAWLLPVRLPLYDDLVDSGALTSAAVGQLRLKNRPLRYITARLDPSGLTLDQLQEVSHRAELARRHYLARDGASMANLPRDDPDVRHYTALLEIRSTGNGRCDDLRPSSRDAFEALEQYLGALSARRGDPPPPVVLADPSTWKLLLKQSLAGRIHLDSESRARHPRFAAWIDLCEVEATIFAKDWSAAIELGQGLLSFVTEERLRDEIQNQMAYAHYQLGNHRAAIDLLNDALTGRHTEALIVNASIVASELGSDFASSFFARVYEDAENPVVGIEALRKAIGLWLSDPDSPTVPVPLIMSIRTALARPAQEDVLKQLAGFASRHDREWMAGGPPISMLTKAHSDIATFYVTLARAQLPDYKEDLTSVAQVLASIHHQDPVPEWAQTELATMTESLMDGVHVKFGEAAHLAPTIKVLINAGVLDLNQGLVLAPQAGAHLAMVRSDNNMSLDPKEERLFFWEPVDLYLKERNNIPPGAREWVAEEIYRCVGVSTIWLLGQTEKVAEQFGREWDALVARERWDQQNYGSILHEEKRLLDNFAKHVARCEHYEKQCSRLPCPEQFRDQARDVRRQIDGWNNEIARLRSTL
jgi:hypothetical protein